MTDTIPPRTPLSHEDLRGYIREAALALRWGIGRRTLQRWRQNGTGPVWFRLNGMVLDREEDLRAFEASGGKEGA